MPRIYTFDKLNFLTAGMPKRTVGSYPEAFKVLEELQLDGMEMEFVHGVKMNDKTQDLIKSLGPENNLVFTAHGPFYVNLNSPEEDKVNASIKRLVDTAIVSDNIGVFSMTYHAAFYMGKDKEAVYEQVKKCNLEIERQLKELNVDIWIRPETTGKPTQWGDLDEIIRLSKELDMVLPCVDFSHIHARSAGKFNTYDEFCKILEKIGNELGDSALKAFHGHLAGIEYSSKGERKHLNFLESDMNYESLLRAFKSFDVRGALTCESPNIEIDTQILKEYYSSL